MNRSKLMQSMNVDKSSNKIGVKKIEQYYSSAKHLVNSNEQLNKDQKERLQTLVDFMVLDIESPKFKQNAKTRTFFKRVQSTIDITREYVDVSHLQKHAN